MTHLRVALVTLGDPERVTGGYLFHRHLAELAPKFDAHIDLVSFPEWRFPLPAFARSSVLRRAGAADVVVLDSIAAAYWGRPRRLAPAAAMLHQPPGGIEHGPLRTRVQSALDRRAYRGVTRKLVAAQQLADDLSAEGLGGDVIVVPPGRDLVDPSPATRDLREDRRIAVLCVANWVRHKGIVELLDAFVLLDRDAATLHLVGDTDVDPYYSARVRARLEDPLVSSRVRVHGILSQDVVAAFYRDSDVFVLPSFKETYGTVYVEAMTWGLPVVGWDAGNLPHLITDGREGAVVPRGDVLGLRDALARLASDDEHRKKLGDAARFRASVFPTWHDTAALFFRTLRSMLGT
jgi:glycosyltransferase involved in cell wall biosynthesis